MSHRGHGTRSAYVGGCRCELCTEANRAYARGSRRYGWHERVADDWCDPAAAALHVKQLRARGMGKRRIAEVAGVPLSIVDNLIYGKRGTPITRMLRRNADAILAVTYNPAPSTPVLAIGARRRLQALQVMGWPLADLAAEIGWAMGNLSTLTSGGRNCNADTHRKIAALYERLCMTPGPSDIVRKRALRKGWLPPLAWDDDTIDDIDARPAGNTGDEVDIDDVAVERFIGGDLSWDRLSTRERIEAAVRMDRAGVSRNTIAERTHLNTRTLWDALRAGSPSESGETIAS